MFAETHGCACFLPAHPAQLFQSRATHRAAGLKGCIQFIGIRKDIERLMSGAMFLLFPSRGEGLGMVVVEAQAAGLPVLAADTVPRECVVVPELVRFQEVEAGEAAWATRFRFSSLNATANMPDANQRVAASAFSIDHSAECAPSLYGKGLCIDQFRFQSAEGPAFRGILCDERRCLFGNQQVRNCALCGTDQPAVN